MEVKTHHTPEETLVETPCLEVWVRLLPDFASHYIQEEAHFRRPMSEEKEIEKKKNTSGSTEKKRNQQNLVYIGSCPTKSSGI